MGAALGAVMAKVDTWMRQREELAGELRAVADKLMAGENFVHTRIYDAVHGQKRGSGGERTGFTYGTSAQDYVGQS